MLKLKAKIRKEGNNKKLRENGGLSSILYGPKTKNQLVEVDAKEFKKIYQEAGENSIITIELEKNDYPVLIHDLQIDPISGQPIHVDFYQPDMEKKIEAQVPVILNGEAPAIKNLGGTLYKNLSEINIKALPHNLPKEIRIDISQLNTFEDHIKIKDIKIGEGIEILGEPEEIVVSVSAPENVEEELAKPVEENVEEVKTIEKEKKEGEDKEIPDEEKKE
jgi:large subunit ribosomal protein L25